MINAPMVPSLFDQGNEHAAREVTGAPTGDDTLRLPSIFGWIT